MPGDYLFPKRRFKHGEPLDPDETNEALQPAVERLNGFVGPHNLRAPLDSAVIAKADTFYRARQVFVELDPGMSDLASAPQVEVVDAYVVEQDTSWRLVESDTAGRDMQVEISTGSSTLSMTAFVSYCFAGYDDGTREAWTLELALPSGDSYADYYNDYGPIVTVQLALEGPADPATATSSQYHSFLITLPSPGNMTEVREKIAKRIANAGADTTPEQVDYAETPPWGTSGYTAKAEGTKVIFTRVNPGASGGSAYFWAKLTARGATDMVFETVSTAATATQPLHTLDSFSTDGAAGGAMVYFPAQVQFALRVDGVVLPETITGRYDNEQGSFQPCRIEDAVSTEVGLMLLRFSERPDALGVPMHTVRLTFDADVRPGTHLVEVVVRRAPMGTNRSFQLPTPTVGTRPDPPEVMPADNRVVLYNRQLRVLEVPREPTDAAVFGDAVTVPALTYEDVVSHESLDDDRLRVVVDALNDVKDYQVARGAINGAHLAGYSTTLAIARANTFSGSLNEASNAYIDPSYVGFTTFGQFYKLYAAPSRWKEIVSAKLTATVSGRCIISVEGNVFLDRLRSVESATAWTTPNVAKRMHLASANFLVGLKSNGTWYLWRPSLAWVNSNHYWASEPSGTTNLEVIAHLSHSPDNNGYDYFDVPVTAEFLFNYDNLGLLRDVDEVGIFGTVCRMKSTMTTASARVKRASINAVVTKA